MNSIILLGLGAVVFTVGAMIVATKKEVSDDFDKSLYTPSAVGCGGVAIALVGVVMFIAGCISAVNGGLS